MPVLVCALAVCLSATLYVPLGYAQSGAGTQGSIIPEDRSRVDVLAQLYDNGELDAAWGLALELQAEWEGDPLFDLYFGLAAIDNGQLDEGVFALERILVVTPDNRQVRLEVARGYYLLGQLDRAENEFETVLASKPPARVRSNIQQYLDAIAEARRQPPQASASATPTAAPAASQVQAWVQLGMGWDTNVNGAPGVAEFATPTLGTGVLSSDAVSDADSFTEFTLGASLRHALSKSWSVDLAVTGVAHVHGQATAFDNRYGSLAANLNYAADALDLRLGVSALKYWLDDTRYQSSLGTSGELGYRLSDEWRGAVFADFSELTYFGQDDRNSQLKTQGLTLAWAPQWPLSPLFSASIYQGDESSDLETVAARSSADRTINGASLDVSLLLNSKINLSTGVQYQDSVYTGVNSVFLVRRHDEFHGLNIGVDYQWQPEWLVRGAFSYSENRSNIEINRYYRSTYSLAVRHNFK